MGHQENHSASLNSPRSQTQFGSEDEETVTCYTDAEEG